MTCYFSDDGRLYTFRNLPVTAAVDLPEDLSYSYDVILCVSVSAKFDICTVVGLNGTLAGTNLRTWDT